MAGVHDFSEKVIDYATRLSNVADAAQGKRRHGGALMRWTMLPASGAALFALVRSDFFARQAKEVVGEARTLASDLPDDLMGVVRQTAGTASGTGSSSQSSRRAGTAGGNSRTKKTGASKKRASSTRRKRASASH